MALLPVATAIHALIVINILPKATLSANIYVSNRATKKEDCGTSEDDPCRTINAAVQIEKKGFSQITIISTGSKYQDCPIHVNKPLAFKGLYGRPVIDCDGGDAFIFNFEEKKTLSSIKLDVSNLKLQNSKAGFKFASEFKTSVVNLRLENITFANNEVDVTWGHSPLCFLVMTNVYTSARSGNAVEIDGCNRTTLSFVNTKFSGKYFKVLSTIKSSILKVSLNEVTFDMSSRATDSSEEVPSLSPVDIVTALEKTSITIASSAFVNHFGHGNGMISITGFKKSKKGYASPVNINFYNVSFINNTVSRGFGGAASFNLTNKLTKAIKHSVIFKRCTFTGNSASNGGAVWFSNWEKKSVQFLDCTFEDNKARAKVTEGGSGGALFALGGKFAITKCKFVGNTATKYGGTLYLSNKNVTSIRITDSVFQNERRSWSKTEGNVIYLNDVQTSFKDRVIFNLSSANSGKPILFFEGRPTTLRMDNTSNFICPRGYNYGELKYTLATKRTKPDYIPTYHSFAFSCKPCPDLFYSTSRGSWLANGTGTRGKCHACPNGASCNGTIRANANFWGETRGDKIEMIPCPKGYCCDREPCESYDSCRAHRTGRLCGHCSDGFTEGLSSTQCFSNEKCNGASWIWPMLSVIGIFIFFCFHQEIINRLVKWSLWNVQDDEQDEHESVEYRREERNQNENQRDTESPDRFQSDDLTNLSLQCVSRPNYARLEESTDYNDSGGYMKVFFYFYQAILLLRLSSYVSSSSVPNSIIEFFTPLLNFQFTNVWKCASDDVRPVTKVFIKNSVAYWVMALSLLAYGLNRFVRCRTGCYVNHKLSSDAKTFPVRLIGTVMHVLLLSYVSQTQFAVQLLNCVSIGDKSFLYVDGSVECYQPFQTAIWLYFMLYIVFFWLSLLVGQSLLIWRLISWKEFVLSCFFPFFFLCYWFYRYLKHRRADKIWRQIPEKADDPFKEHVIYILRYPYRTRQFPNATMAERCSENWEAFSIFRRFVLVLSFIFVKSLLLRAYLFFILSVVFLLAHVFVQPFKNTMVNKLDNISLAVIVLISGLSISEATYNNSGQLVPHSIEVVQDLQDWFLALIPFVLLGIFLYPRFRHHLSILRRVNRPRYRAVVSSDDEPLPAEPRSSNETERLVDEASRLTV